MERNFCKTICEFWILATVGLLREQKSRERGRRNFAKPFCEFCESLSVSRVRTNKGVNNYDKQPDVLSAKRWGNFFALVSFVNPFL
jgi:hypothetical protein